MRRIGQGHGEEGLARGMGGRDWPGAWGGGYGRDVGHDGDMTEEKEWVVGGLEFKQLILACIAHYLCFFRYFCCLECLQVFHNAFIVSETAYYLRYANKVGLGPPLHEFESICGKNWGGGGGGGGKEQRLNK